MRFVFLLYIFEYRVYIWNIYMEKCVKEYQLRCDPLPPGKRVLDHASLVSISIRPIHQTFIVSGGNKIEQWHISRELSFKEHKGHTGPIVAIMSIAKAANGGGKHMYEAGEDEDENAVEQFDAADHGDGTFQN